MVEELPSTEEIKPLNRFTSMDEANGGIVGRDKRVGRGRRL